MFSGLIGLAWTIIIVLKIAGLAFLTTSWWLIILWPLAPIAVLLLLGLFGLGIGSLFYVVASKRRYR